MRKLVGGSNNTGIELVIESGSGRSAIRKSLHPESVRSSVGDEVGMMRRLAGHGNIVRIYDFIPAPPQSSCHDQLYVEYCKSLVRGRETNTVFQLSKLYMQEGKAAPEVFLWHLLEGLLKGIVYMQFGIQDVDEEPQPDWETVFHNDLCASNVFLSSKGPNAKPIMLRNEYPRIVIGDFGQANTAAGMNKYYSRAANAEFWMSLRPSGLDIQSIIGISELFTEAECAWVYSEELQKMLTGLQGLQDKSPDIILLLRILVKTKSKLVKEGKLVFQPLLE